MYSLVLMVAMSQGAATPAWEPEAGLAGTNFIHATAHEHFRFGRHGCHGCRGGGCYGGGYGGGCYGGGCRGGGCYGGGYGGGCYGGGGYGGGCWGGGYAMGCMGGYGGCWGGGYAMGCTGGYAGMGYGYGAPYATGYTYGGMPYGYSSGYFGAPVFEGEPRYGTEPGRTDRGERREERREERGARPEKPEALGEAPAKLIVTLPADATLTVDDTPTRATSGVRSFISPPLPPDRDFHYTLKAEALRDGKPVSVSKRVAVRAGEETRVTLELPRAVASK